MILVTELVRRSVEAAVDAALDEVRRQGGPDYLLNEARSMGLAAGKTRYRSLRGWLPPTAITLAMESPEILEKIAMTAMFVDMSRTVGPLPVLDRVVNALDILRHVLVESGLRLPIGWNSEESLKEKDLSYSFKNFLLLWSIR